MKLLAASAVLLCCGTIALAGAAADGPPEWAYGTSPEAAQAGHAETAPASTLEHLSGTNFTFTRAQIGNPFGPADWFPDSHPKMPEIVAHGRKPQIWACSLCHYPNGKGRPENAGVNGFPPAYFIEQMKEFRDGQRTSADTRKKNTQRMITYAKTMSDEEIKEAAEYFGAMPWTPWIKVVETKTVPKTRTSVGMYLPIEGAGTEPIGERIIEVPVAPDATEVRRDTRSGFIAYAPPGSVAKGKALVTNGGGKTAACAGCHGADLKGMGPVPGIAGRSPSYLVRQLYDMRQGTRHGLWTELMKPVVERLNQKDMLNIAAYTASR